MARLFPANGRNHQSASVSLIGLPALQSLIPPASCGTEKASLIFRLLRQAALKSRQTKSCEFYSIRAVARHFAVPPTTVTRIYGQLKDEGVLCSIWGSKTVIEPRTLDKELRIRGVVALPASLRSFSTIPNYRRFFNSMRDVLWKLGFAPRLVFDETPDANGVNFADALLNYKIDGALWFLPSSSRIPNTVSRLIDRGIRSITVINALPRNGRPGYYVSRRSAIKKAVATWKREGIKSVTILHQTHGDSIERIVETEACLREIGIPYIIVDAAAPPQDCFHALARRKCSAILFTSSDIALQFGWHDRVQFEKLLTQHRALLLEGPVDFPLSDPINAEVDIIQVDWQPAARRIGSDLLTFSPLTKQNTVVLEAKLVPRTSINGYQPRMVTYPFEETDLHRLRSKDLTLEEKI